MPFGLRNPAFRMSETLPVLPITPMNYCTSAKGVFDDTTPEQMHEAITAYAKVCTQQALALFFHGGLVAKSSGMQNAQQLLGPYSASSAPNNNAGAAYPYFFVWESGLIETLEHNLPGIAQETIFQRILSIVGDKASSLLTGSPKPGVANAMLRTPTLTAVVDAGPIVVSLTQSDISEVEQAVEHDDLINAEKRLIALQARNVPEALSQAEGATPRVVMTSPRTYLSPEIVAAVTAEEQYKVAITPLTARALWNPIELGTLAIGAGKVLQRIIQRYATGRNHNFHNTVVEEIFRQYYVANVGWAIWNEMKVETGEAFTGDAQHNVGTAMIKELLGVYSAPGGIKARITLLGHSTGAVYICNFLAAMDAALNGSVYQNQVTFDVIFMAAAVRADLFADTIAQHGHLIRNFRSFEMSDPLEAAEILLQFDGAPVPVNAILAEVYTSSLLYFISGSLEDTDDDTPLDGMQRFFLGTGAFAPGSFADIDAVKKFYSRQTNPVVTSDTSELLPEPGLGLRCTAYHHGGFPSDDGSGAGGTLQSVCYLLKTGLY